jgi:hypothetical protein
MSVLTAATAERLPDGSDFEGVRIQPAHPVSLTPEAVRNGTDEIMRKALQVVEASK